MMNLKGEEKWPLRDIHIIMNDGQPINLNKYFRAHISMEFRLTNDA
jgi:hypothetical protein